ncbi:cell envelope integrity protein CreD [Leptospira kanakyensis]|uniref:Cell envelope integrity protein CreD n=1 Tax=Leptospira kanakyensis TaxID=2484968 RepID=A0A6N4Q0D5_9LEPT|nr:cell envelope integrity protein CreD [Leptospira kanakyensis]MCW7469552.1 cell envelope integrity protein CreD [Leptospira kanakyensis]TGK50722.1 cell envelope integrity protein CreD [Leptospira kanakyensis]TGK63677.1 cell envelope integrity protein CreD [Leptospira kanakyensis]TGK69859.1 cell envelope integrity protein CreD [Leptospira kanakyensis]
MSKLQTSVNLRLAILGGMVLLFIIPLIMVGSLIEERSASRNQAVLEVGEKWGSNQTIVGPVLMIPYNLRIPKSGSSKEKDKWDYVTDYAYFLPEEMDSVVDMKTELRKRSIYEIPLYTSKVKITGKFSPIFSSDFPIDTTYIYWDDVRLVVSVSDLKGLGGEMKLTLAGKDKKFLPGTRSSYLHSGLNSTVSIGEAGNSIPFEIQLEVKGSESFSVIPIGKKSKLMMSSDWKDPSFNGNLLPKDRSVNEEGFSAVWESSYFARSYPQIIHSMNDSILETILNSGYGVSLVIPVDHYLKMERSVKYGLLFIVTSFALFFLMEVFGGVLLHPIQYVLIGSAMVLFYILNLSFSEHLGFLPAYILSSLAVTGLIGYYAINVLKNQKKGLITASYYLVLYSFLYVILASEEQALLLGSLALFMVLAAVMHFTRKVDWYQFGGKNVG